MTKHDLNPYFTKLIATSLTREVRGLAYYADVLGVSAGYVWFEVRKNLSGGHHSKTEYVGTLKINLEGKTSVREVFEEIDKMASLPRGTHYAH